MVGKSSVKVGRCASEAILPGLSKKQIDLMIFNPPDAAVSGSFFLWVKSLISILASQY